MINLLALSIIAMLGGDPARYYFQADTQEQAETIAEEMNAELLSFTDGVAVYTIKRPIKSILRTIGIDTYSSEETATIDGQSVTLTQDGVYYLDDFETGANPALNKGFKESPFDCIEWENAYKNGITGNGAVVAVLDTGCNITHEDLRENIIGGYNAVDGTQNVIDENGHGTHVAGTIAARDNTVGNIGVAPDAKIYVVKVFVRENGKDLAYTSDLIKGLNRCIKQGNIDVINMSLGGTGYDENFRDAMERCMDAGILCVVAAGNESTDKPHYPAAFGIGLRVAAYDQSAKGLAYFSNYGENSNVAAPGVKIYSSFKGKDSNYAYLSGTSMASPHVAGVAALIYGENDIPKTRAGADNVMNLILGNTDGKTYNYNGHEVTGGVDIQNIFHAPYVRTPQKPEITVEGQKDTGQKIVTIAGQDIIYTLDGSAPSIYNGRKYTDPIRLDKEGTYKLRAISLKKRSGSKIAKLKITVDPGVISEPRVESVKLTGKKKCAPGKSVQIGIENTGDPIPAEKFTWSVNKDTATVDSTGRVTVKATAKPGDTFKVRAKLGDTVKKKKITVK